MQRVTKKTTALVATAAVVGFSSLFLVTTPASAAPAACGNGAILLTGNVCELTLTTVGASVFTPTAEVSKLEALLVAGGGSGSDTSQGYGSGGGGGEVTVVGFGTDSTTPVDVVVGGAGQPSSATQGATAGVARAGFSTVGAAGGASGNGNPGYVSPTPGAGAGAGAGASPVDQFSGGAGATVASIAPSGSLFSGDTDCFGGGGAIGVHSASIGAATCGGGYVVDGATDVTPVAATPNSGGGGAGGGSTTLDAALRSGASGVVVFRWLALADVTVTFESNGHGAPVAPQTFPEGGTATRPADPSESGYVFGGWFADAALTTPADFSAPVAASATLYASWSAVVIPTPAPTPTPAPAPAPTPAPAPAPQPAAAPSTAPVVTSVDPQLASTGGTIDPAVLPGALAVLALGLALVIRGARRARRAN